MFLKLIAAKYQCSVLLAMCTAVHCSILDQVIQKSGPMGGVKYFTTGKVPRNKKTPETMFTTPEVKNPAYGKHSALSYVCDSGVPILYHESKSIPWVLSIP